jgi:alpha-L-arabinofuranosidase
MNATNYFPVIRVTLLSAALAFGSLGGQAAEGVAPASLVIRADRPGPRVSPTLYGIFFEGINCAGDGGLYAEMVRNRSFEDSDRPEHWMLVCDGTAKGEMAVDTEHPLSAGNRRSLKLTIAEGGSGRAGIASEGYWGLSLKQGEAYHLSLNARAAAGFSGPLAVTLVSRQGKVYARQELAGLTEDWKAFRTTLVPDGTDASARLVISASNPATIWLDMVSLFPRRTWNGETNGLRPDLAGMLEGLHPAFVRFPGGCWVEGDTLDLAYRWKQTVGPPSERRNQYNLWQYYSTHGLGFHEYLRLCEDLGAEPLFVINCGMSHHGNVPMNDLGAWVQDALDALEYANGPTDSHWGGLRAANGHPAPFHLKYLEVGNENGGPAYRERYAAFYQAIKKKHPEMRLVADEWGGVPADTPVDIVDEHYYSSPAFFIQQAGRYDTYDRAGRRVYVGEYAVTQDCGKGNLRAALGEAAFMTGLERNSDVVIMASYAPLFANVNYKKWNPDLINFDNSRVFGTPSYYVQKMFARNRADVVLPAQVEAGDAAGTEQAEHGGIGLGTWETQAEYKDITVTQGERELFGWDAAAGTNGWRVLGGAWGVKGGGLQQTASGTGRRILTGDLAWRDYTLTLKARKLGGAEGFLVMFHVQDEKNWLWWNIGGWGNTRHALEQCIDGGKSILGESVAGAVETGRWYDLRLELNGAAIRCFLDGKQIHNVKSARSLPPLHVVAGRAERSGEIIVKTVNVSDRDYDTAIRFEGVGQVHGPALATVLTSASPADENSLDQPTRVAPVEQPVPEAAPSFHHRFPAHSLTVMRVKAE